MQQLLGANSNINSPANIFGDFFVPGTPKVNVSGSPVWNGQLSGGGSASPSNYSVNINSGAHLNHLVTRTDPGTLDAIPAPPSPSGSRTININNPSQVANIGDWGTVRNVNLGFNAGNVAVPPGTYGNFAASNSGGTGFVFGVAGSSEPAIYNLQQLSLNFNSRLTLVGPVIITVRNQVSVNSNSAILGSPDDQAWLRLYSSNGDFNVNSGAIIYGEVKAPSGHINLNGTIVGTAAADYLNINTTGVLKPGVTNREPQAQDDSYVTNEDVMLTVAAPGVLGNDSDPDDDTLSAVKVSEPAHGTLAFNANGSFNYVPAANYHGADSFTYKAGDGTLFSDVVTVNITVNPVNDAPVAQDGTLATNEDAAKGGQLYASDIDGDALTFSIVTPPQHGTVQLGENGAFTYTPEADYNGADSFIFKVNDGQADSSQATIAITVNPLNDAPVAWDDAYQVAERQILRVFAPGVLANDEDPDDDTLTASVLLQPAHGTLIFHADGSFIYQPQDDYTGPDSFTYKIDDGHGGQATARVQLAVTPVNEAPRAVDDTAESPGTALDIAVLANDTDPDGDPLTVDLVEPSSDEAEVSINPDGTVRFVPSPGFDGTFTFTYVISDPGGLQDAALVTVTMAKPAPIDTRGTEFWLAFPGNEAQFRDVPDNHLTISISAQTAATGQVEVPAIDFQQAFTLAAGQDVDIELPSTIQLDSYDGVEDLAIHVTSDNPISVYGVNFCTYQTEGFLGLPVRSLGMEYMILSYSPVWSSQLSLVGTDNNTQVTITPKTSSGNGRQAGVPYSITLNKGQTYQLRGSEDLTGSVVSSTKPVSVYGGNSCANVPSEYGYCNQLVEQLLPTKVWGSEFFTMPLARRSNGDSFRFLAQTDGTTVSVNGVVVATLNRGQYHEQIINGPAQITSSHPLSVAQYSNGAEYDFGTADPFMMLAPSTSQYASRYTLTTPQSGIGSNFVNLIVPSASTGNIRMDGEEVAASSFTTIGDGSYSGVQIPVSIGSHTFVSTDNAEFGVFLYGFDDADGYGYPGALGKSADLPPDTTPPDTDPPGPDTTPPVVSIITPMDGSYQDSLSWISGDASDDADGQGLQDVTLSVKRQSDGKYWTGSEWGDETQLNVVRVGDHWWKFDGLPQGDDLPDGDYVLTVTATDKAGNSTVEQITVHIDAHSPLLAFTAPTDKAVIPGLPQVTGTASDAGSGVSQVDLWIQDQLGQFWDGTSWQDDETPLATTLDDGVWSRTDGLPSGSDLPDGLYYLRADATDGAGHTASISIVVRVQNLLPGSAQADGLIRTISGTDIGNDIYNTTGENQTAQQTAAAGSPAQYLITAQNDGITPQKLAVRVPDVVAQWTVHYFDGDNNDITSALLAGNWQTPLLNPGQSVTIRATVEPDGSLPGESTLSLSVAVDSTQDGSRDVVRAVTTKEADPPPAPARPDGQISTDGTAFLGDDVYNTSGANQTAQLAIDGGTTATYHLKLQNDSASPDRLVLFSGNSTTWDTTFFDSDNNDITEAVKSTSGWATPELAAGVSASVRVEVFAATSIAPGSSLNMSLGIASQRDPSSLDILRAITSITVPPPPTWQADALIRNATDSADTGDDIYNITGENQTTQQTATATTPAQYLITAQNDGSAPQSLVIHGPVAAAPWQVHYYDGANTDITDAVKSTLGWQTPQLMPGAKAVIRLEVAPDSNLLGESTLSLGVAVDSPQDGSRDVVLAVTHKEAEPPQAAARPDAQINGGAGYVGDNVYNANGADQTVSKEVDAGQTATYYLKLQNDSTDPDHLVLLAGASPDVQYFDSANTNITDVVTDPNTGWITAELASGASAEVRVEVTPPAGMAPGDSINLLLGVYSQRDSSLDMAKAVTAIKLPPPPTWRADGLIRGSTETADLGDNVYNITGEDQTSQQTATSETAASYFIKAQNDGSAPQKLAITGATDMPWWYIRYVDSNDVDITGSIAAGGWLTPVLMPGESAIIRLDVMPEAGLPNGSSFRLPVGITSTQDGSVDMVLAWTAVGAFPGSSSSQAPDLVIGDMLSEAGDGIYNSTGEDQTFAKSVQANETAYYDIALQNDNTTAQKFVLTLPALAGAGWEVRLVDADGGNVDITDDARDIAGAISPEMQPGEEYLLYVAVTPDVGVADNAVQESLLVATTEDGSQQDAVKMETTRLPKSGDTDPTEPPDPTKVLPAPVISPEGGTYTGMVKVNITPGAQSPSATIIYYSLDGSEPGPGNPASRPSSGTILLVQNATVKAKAYAIGFNPSPDASATYTITQEPGSGAPGVNIATPGDGAEITAPTAVTGDVNSDNLAYWELGVRPMAANQSTDGPWQRIAWGETTVSNGQLGVLDPTLLLNGLYEVRLIAYDRAGQSVEDFVHVVIKGGMKIGNFTLSFTDMVLPVAGMPLSVTRTYDSRDKRIGDFGVGWSLGISDVRVQKNGIVGGSDQMQIWNSHKVPGGGLFGTYVIDAVKPRIVTIILPDGTVYSFRAKVQPEQQSLQPITYGTIAWAPQPGTKGTLQIVGDNSFQADTLGPVTLTDDFGNPVDYHEFILTLPDGRQFYVEEGKGLHWMRDRNGNRIDLLRDGSGHIMQLSSTPAGASSPARSVFFTRNADGQITSISDAKGAKVLYTQDENNDLVKVTDRTNTVTRFVYDPLHNIVDIRDPRGVQAVRNEYDEDGRLIATIDAKGNRIEFDHDIAGRMETVLDRKGRQSVLHYDDYGNVTSTTRILDGRTITTSSEYGDTNNPDKPTKTTDALGNSTTFAYDANGSPTQITDPLGHTTQMTYDGTQVKTVTDAAGVVVVDNTYNTNGQLTSSKDALGNTTTYDYFPSGAPKRVTDAKGKSTSYALDSNYNIASVTNAKGHIVAFNYDANGNKIKQTTNRTAADGSLQTLITDYKYDGNGRLTQTTRPDGSNSYTTYNAIGKVDYTRDALNRIISFEYDELGQKTGTTYPDGTTSATSYDDNGNVLASKDRAGRVTNYVYDELDRQIKTVAPDGSFTHQVYDDAGRVTESFDEKNHKTSYEYDDAGRQKKVTDALGHETITSYDSRDRQTSVEDALHKITSFTYDDAGRLLSTKYADNTTTSSVYDELGRAIQQTDQAGHVTKFAFDDLGRLVGVDQVMDASDSSKDLITTYAYDEVGNKILQTDAKGNRTEFAYDNMGRLTGRKLPGGQIEAMLYNSIGQLTAKTDFAGKTTHYSYDQRGRLTQKVPDASLGEATVSFSYPNELTKISTRGSIQNVYKYDAQRGWLNSVQTINGTIQYSHDAAGNRTAVKITGKDGGVRETDYAYDELNRVASVSRVGVGTLANYSYTAVGNVANVTRANGVTSSYDYDDLHRLTAIEHKKGTEVLSQFNYALSADGKRNTLVEYLKCPASQTIASVNRTVFYGYDAAGRLNAEQRQSRQNLVAGGTIEKTDRTLWTYDKAGNRLTQAVSNYDGIGITSPSVLKSTFNTGYDYNSNDWLTKTTSTRHDDTGDSTFVTNFEYNQNGSQKAVTSNVGKPEEKRVPYFYDFEEKLTAIGDPTDTTRHAYWYDADGNRIVESNTSTAGTNVRNYLIDPNNSNAQIVEEYDNANALQAHYDWNNAELLREASWNTITNVYDIHEPIADGHNNIRQLLDNASAVSDVYVFDAWGNQQEKIGGSLNLYRYNTQRLDASGLYYLRARQYSSGAGRFLTHDPFIGDIDNPITQHRYLYAGDDPINAIDPSGQETLAGTIASTSIAGSLSGGIIGGIRGGVKGAVIGALSGAILSPLAAVGTIGVGIGVAAVTSLSETTAIFATGITVSGASVAWNTYDYLNAKNDRERLAAGVSILFTAGFATIGTARYSQLSELPNLTPADSKPILPGSKSALGEYLSESQALYRGEVVVGRQVSVDANLGDGRTVRVRVDLVTRTLNGTYRFIESKFGPSADYTSNQKIGYPALSQNGGTVAGANGESAGLPAGTQLGPTEVLVNRWNSNK